MWAAIVAFLGAFSPLILKVCELLVVLIEPFIKLVAVWIGYFELKKLRIKNAIDSEIEDRKRAVAHQYAKERANVNAFKVIEQQAWKDRYEDILKFIKAKEYEKVLVLRKKIDDPTVDDILFSDLSDEYKAVKIIGVMKKDA